MKRKQVRELCKTKIAMLSDWLFAKVVNIATAKANRSLLFTSALRIREYNSSQS